MPACRRTASRLMLAAVVLLFTAMPEASAQRNQGPPVVAAPAAPVTNVSPAMPDRLTRPMQVIDPVTLRAEGTEIRIWGIQPIETSNSPIGLRAMERVDQMITGQQVSCKIESGTIPVLVGRCATASGDDIALTLLNEGLAVRNRRQTYATTFAQAYGQAEEAARNARKGVWSYLTEEARQKEQLSPEMLMLMLIGVPATGFIIMGVLIWAMLQKVVSAQKLEFSRARKKDSALAEREKSVLVSILEAELLENKNKIDAFFSIYTEMLRSLRDLSETPKYQQVGDIVQKHPSFSHAVFDANVNKLSVLGIQLAGRVSKLYTALPRTQEYITLDPNVPLETAIKLVEKTLDEAKDLVGPLNTILNELQHTEENKAA